MRRDWFTAFAAATGKSMEEGHRSSGGPCRPCRPLSPMVSATACHIQVIDNKCTSEPVAPVAQLFEAEAANMAHGNVFPTEWADGLSFLFCMPPPSEFPLMRWDQIVFDAAKFIDGWAASAAALGWTALDLFGVGKDAPYHRLDLMGLVPLIGGKAVVAMTETAARLRCGDGTMQTFHRKPAQAGRVALWNLE